MFLTIAIVLLILWALGFATRTLGGMIHIILLLAVVAVVLHFVRG